MTQKERAEAILKNSFDKNIKPLCGLTFEEVKEGTGYNWIYEAMLSFLEQETKTVECFVPVSIDKLPEEAGWYNMQSTDGFPKEAGRVYFDGSAFLWADTSAGIYYKQGWKLEWLKKTTIKAISK